MSPGGEDRLTTESLESLWAYCIANGRIIPCDWTRVYRMLKNKRQKSSGGWEPPLPLILAAWNCTTALEKQLRFKEHIQWAHAESQLAEIGNYLRTLCETDWYHIGEL